ncbi:phytanoyl-CoA dioxygenase family protein [Salinarimonas rosea]|uniref:phytanoyl-CoA dioxygenase family protein n=1 Tax=Salinarimonas rosea TaxID=552063 RepID=UPI000411CB9D|nr:phytanoyl-CoA dioxygenase family protein [Salinarimonas rosea]
MSVRRYGILKQREIAGEVQRAAEELATFGYTLVDSGYPDAALDRIEASFMRARVASEERFGRSRLEAVDEHNTIRLPMLYDRVFLELATHPMILALCREMIGPVVLSQQNGVVNPGGGGPYNQGAFHRDLPYQHFTSSRPLAINALFCVDDFTVDNGGTIVLPASHRIEEFPSEPFIAAHALPISAPRGTFIVLDCMAFHSGGSNATERDRRAVNHVYTTPVIKQQIDIPLALGPSFTEDTETRWLLGYGMSVPRGVEAYIAQREAKQ